MGGEIDFASGAGFLHSRFFAFLGPLLLMVFTITFASRTLAGEEKEGTLELVLATPVPRRSVIAREAGRVADRNGDPRAGALGRLRARERRRTRCVGRPYR